MDSGGTPRRAPGSVGWEKEPGMPSGNKPKQALGSYTCPPGVGKTETTHGGGVACAEFQRQEGVRGNSGWSEGRWEMGEADGDTSREVRSPDFLWKCFDQ